LVFAAVTNFLLQFCTNKKDIAFEKAEEVKTIVKSLTSSAKYTGNFLLMRVDRCNVCTDSTIAAVKKLPNGSNTIILADGYNKKINEICVMKNFYVIIKDHNYYQKKGVDFGDNYLFVFNNGEIQTFFNATNVSEIAKKFK
jgi:hypothetical protein